MFCCDLYYCSKNFIYINIYIYNCIRGGVGQVPTGPQVVGMGKGSLPRTPGRGKAGTKIPSSGPTLPYCHPYNLLWQFLKALLLVSYSGDFQNCREKNAGVRRVFCSDPTCILPGDSWLRAFIPTP